MRYGHFMCSLALMILLSVSNCQKLGSLGPDDKSDRRYHLYVGDWNGKEVFVIDTRSNTVIDTLQGFENYIWDLVMTKSGNRLYVSTKEGPHNAPGKVFAVETKTKAISMIWNGIASDVFVAPSGEVFLFSYEPRSEDAQYGPVYVSILDTLSNAMTLIDTLDIRNTGYNYQSVVFDHKQPVFFAVTGSGQLFAYNYRERKEIRRYQNFFGPKLRLILSSDGYFIYSAGGPICDLKNDSVVATLGGNQLGSLALHPNGNSLYVTDPGNYLILEPVPTGKILIFDTRNNRFSDEVDVKNMTPPGHGWQTDRIVLMPDGKTAYVSNWIDLVYVVDLPRKIVREIIPLRAQVVPMVLGPTHSGEP